MIHPPETFETARLLLRKPVMEDAQAVFETWAQDPKVTRTMTWYPHKDVDETRAFLSWTIEEWEGESRFVFVITKKSALQPIGMIEMRPSGHAAELGYVLAYKEWGKGYMTEAAQALVNWIFTQPGMCRIYATTSVDNIGSQRVMEKIGMTREGLMRKHIIHPNVSDEPVDSYLYAVVK